MAVDLLLVAILLGVVRAPGVLLGFVLALILLRVTSRAAGGNLLGRSVRFAVRGAAALILFITAITLWNASGNALERMRADDPPAGQSADSAAAPEAEIERIRGELAATQDSSMQLDALRAAFQVTRPTTIAPAAAQTADSAAPIEADSATLAVHATNATLREENAEMEERVEALRRELEDERASGGRLTRMLRTVADDLGIGFGWAAVYFTCFLALGRGQTPGKRMLGLRVIRLNGKPITWWIAFERFGGYTASLSTGLLGFAQILWDRNRQGIHDKVAETVVVLTRDEHPSIPTAEPPVQAA